MPAPLCITVPLVLIGYAFFFLLLPRAGPLSLTSGLVVGAILMLYSIADCLVGPEKDYRRFIVHLVVVVCLVLPMVALFAIGASS